MDGREAGGGWDMGWDNVDDWEFGSLGDCQAEAGSLGLEVCGPAAETHNANNSFVARGVREGRRACVRDVGDR